MRVLVLDARDSFVETLARYFRLEGAETVIRRADALALEDVEAQRPDILALSPGPCTPREAGVFIPAVRRFAERVPIFGVCLGHLAIAAAFGGGWRTTEPVHGRASLIRHDGHPLFSNVGTTFEAGRYHALLAEIAPAGPLKPIARTDGEGLLMAIAHESLPIVGVQFHPESALTPDGRRLIRNFLAFARR